MTTSVVRDAPEAVVHEKEHLCVPHVRIQGPAVRERDNWTIPPVLVIDLRAILGGDVAAVLGLGKFSLVHSDSFLT